MVLAAMSRVCSSADDQPQRRQARLVLGLQGSLGLSHQPVAHGMLLFGGHLWAPDVRCKPALTLAGRFP